MATWGQRRQAMYIGTFLVIVLALVVPVILSALPKASCTDGRKNQGEHDIDCGGPCVTVCLSEVAPVANLWARPFKVADGVYSAVSFVSNRNSNVLAHNVPYTIKLYDKKNILIAERHGVTDILPKSDFPIFEGGIETGKTEVGEVYFEFNSAPVWERVTKEQPKLTVLTPTITLLPTPKVVVTIRNDSAQNLKETLVDVVLFDKEGNAVNASETVLPALKKNESSEVVFTWLSAFSGEVNRIEVYPKGIR
jgi:hypothetical protein